MYNCCRSLLLIRNHYLQFSVLASARQVCTHSEFLTSTSIEPDQQEHCIGKQELGEWRLSLIGWETGICFSCRRRTNDYHLLLRHLIGLSRKFYFSAQIVDWSLASTLQISISHQMNSKKRKYYRIKFDFAEVAMPSDGNNDRPTFYHFWNMTSF